MKKILFIGVDILTKANATGITLRSIFKEIEPDNCLGISWGQSQKQLNNIPFKFISLPYKHFSIARILDNDHLRQMSRSIKKADNHTQIKQGKNNNEHFISKWIRNIRQWVALLPAKAELLIKDEDINEIRAFSPQVIYTIGETITALNLAYTLSVQLEIPIIIHFMDNWRHAIEWDNNPLLKRYQKKLTEICDLCYSRTTECVAIGERMAEAYEYETGIKHSVIMNSIDTKKYFCLPKQEEGTIHFVYAGGLHLGRDRSLEMIGKCIDRACVHSGFSAALDIFTSMDDIDMFSEQFNSLSNTFLRPAVSHDQIQEVYQNSDILVHVESKELKNNTFFKYSVSTKIPEYLATGRPLLFYGPEDISLFRFLRDNRLAYTVSNEDELQKAVECLLNRKENQYGTNAIKYAKEHFDISVACDQFNRVVDEVRLPC